QLESKGFLEGVTDFVRKPPLPEVIRQRVRRVLQYEYLQENLAHEVSRQTAIAARRLEESQELFREMAIALAKTIDAKDNYTHGHSERVAAYARMISKRAGDDEEAQERIYYMGLLHDIGKIGVAETIINKTSRLDDEEFHSIQYHTIIGSEILRNIHQFPDLSVGARSHHERYDGKGYPDKLAGDAIPRSARIIAVADTYDAMTSSRSYRKGLPQDVARAEIEKGKGTQFDPHFADLMLELIDEDKDFTMCDREEE
ncbi:MAG: HD-GYP domain-containing protein, partial [Schwartzia sp.]|nr:HD-GYP domain-containing protein [Schwartzia sp. (in: firmicutes)]